MISVVSDRELNVTVVLSNVAVHRVNLYFFIGGLRMNAGPGGRHALFLTFRIPDSRLVVEFDSFLLLEVSGSGGPDLASKGYCKNNHINVKYSKTPA